MTSDAPLLLAIGNAAGFGLGCVLAQYRASLYRMILIMKARPKNRTPEKIGDGFYYIVPEREYVRMETALLRAAGERDDK